LPKDFFNRLLARPGNGVWGVPDWFRLAPAAEFTTAAAETGELASV
jgi:hypothetical protein